MQIGTECKTELMVGGTLIQLYSLLFSTKQPLQHGFNTSGTGSDEVDLD